MFTRQNLTPFFAAVAALALCSGCSDENIGGAFMNRRIKNTPQYKLTVNISPSDDCGSVSLNPEKPNSTYLSGTVVTLTANAKANGGYKFKNWSGVSGQYGSTSTTATVVMDGNKEVTAVFEAVTYAVTLSAGTGAIGGGEYAAGATVIITAGTAPDGKRFKNWTTASNGVTFADANSAATTFTMPKNAVAVTANFEDVPSGKYAVTVSSVGTDVIGNDNYAAGATVTIFAGTPPDGQEFKNWTSTDGVVFVDANSATTTFTMPARSVTVTAVFEGSSIPITTPTTYYAVTVLGGGTGSSGGGDYAEGTTVTISAGTPPTGQQFKNWTTSSSGVTFVNAISATTTFTMPAGAVTVTANFIPQRGRATLSSNNMLTDVDDGKAYRTIVIGGKRWMAENLNYWTSSGSWCYNDDNSKCNEYGRLYDWETAMTTCPGGWHLPDTADWRRLVEAAGGIEVAGKKLKSTSGWNSYNGVSGNGTDDHGFSALPGGFHNTSGNFLADSYGFWWTATEVSSFFAYYRIMRQSNDYVSEDYNTYGGKEFGRSVRCVQDGNGSNTMPTTYYLIVSSAGTGSSGGGNYAAGATVTISAGTAPNGRMFKNWTTVSAGVTLANASSATTTFIMPANAVTVTANFRQALPDGDGGTLTYDGQEYRTVVIDGERWMAENLNYWTSSGSWCVGNNADSCAKYGRLYNWNTAMTVCPSGWHLSDTADWHRLVEAAGGMDVAGKKLKATYGWNGYNSNGTDEYGFSALPGGGHDDYYYWSDAFYNVGNTGQWWTATESGSNAYLQYISSNDYMGGAFATNRDTGNSVRCVQD